MVLVLAMATDADSGRIRDIDPAAAAGGIVEAVEAASSFDAQRLITRHLSAYRKLHDRVVLRLGTSDRADTPTDRRLAELKAGRSDAALQR